MTQEDKELLLKDLCARLPYGVIIQEYNEEYGYTDNALNTIGIGYFSIHEASIEGTWINHIENVRPYLRSISSMTEEEFEKLKEYSGLKYEQLDLASYQNGTYKCLDFYLSEVPSYVVILVFDWLNAHHFDYRGLIEKGLAIEVTKDNNPYEN